MTKEEKQLLLIDISARLPYGIKFYVDNTIPPIPSEVDYRDGRVYYTLTATGIDICEGCIFTEETGMDCALFVNHHSKEIQVLKPYLRPLSSMTMEEKKEYESFIFTQHHEWDGHGTSTKYVETDDVERYVTWLNRKMFDHRGLIPMGLALVAKEGMYV